MNISLAGNIQYQAPGGSQANLSLSSQATYTAQQLGTVDIPSGTVGSSAFVLPMGGVATGKGYYVKSNCAVMLAINSGTGTTQMQGIATGGVVAALGSLPAKQQAVTSLIIVVPAAMATDGAVEYAVWGD